MKASFEVGKDFRCKDWVCIFKVDGEYDTDYKPTNGTGVSLYATKEKAIAAGKRYLKKMKKNGFEV